MRVAARAGRVVSTEPGTVQDQSGTVPNREVIHGFSPDCQVWLSLVEARIVIPC